MIRLASLRDIDRVVDLLKDSFDCSIRPYLAYTQVGIGDFLSSQVRSPWAYPGRRHLVIEADGCVVGYAEVREEAGGYGFLSYICVAESHRGKGLARALLAWWLQSAASILTVELDVFRSNASAHALYSKLGFEPVRNAVWLSRTTPEPVLGLQARDLHVAEAGLNVYGFSELVLLDEKCDRIGLMGVERLRCFDANSFSDDSLLGRVVGAMPLRSEAFVVMDEDEYSARSLSLPNHRVILESTRMKANAVTVRRRLKGATL